MQITIVGVVLGIAFIFFSYGSDAFYPYVSGAVSGLIAGFSISILELYIFTRGAKKITFIWLLTLKSAIYLILFSTIIFNVVVFSRISRLNMSYLEVLNDTTFQYYLTHGLFKIEVIYTLIFAYVINFTRMMSRKMGQGMLANYITGTYYKPVHEARIVMFIRIVGSRKLLDKQGPLSFHRFLNNFYFDVSNPAISRGGVIHEYVEDLMVITWPINKGLVNVNCIQTYFDIQKLIKLKTEKYNRLFGFEPRIQAGIHTGAVVISEIGEVKTQIVISGDTMNTTSRILDQCGVQKVDFLASDQILRMLGLPKNIHTIPVGEIKLKGKLESMALYGIKDFN